MTLLIKDTYFAIDLNDSKYEKLISKNFTFKDHSAAVTAAGYDPMKVKNVKLFTKKNNLFIFRSGFLMEFLLLCKTYNIKIDEVKDERTKYEFQKVYSYDFLRKFFNPDFDYVDHQIKALQAMLKTNVGVLKLPTSSGKSSILSAYLKLTKVPTIVIVDGVSLSDQLRQNLIDDGIEDVGVCNGKKLKEGYHTVSTIGSVKKLNLVKYECLIFDECHSSAAATAQDFLSKVSYPLRFGLSATPEGNCKFRWAKIRQYLGGIISETKAQELLDNEVITPPKITFIEVKCKPTLDWISANNINIICNEERNNKIKQIVEHYNLPTLILFRNLDHGEIIKDLLPENSVLLSGENSLKERKDAVEKFKNGEIKILIASNIFKQGISINNIQLMINASGGKSEIEVLQKLGRSLRKCEGKDYAYVYDFDDIGNKFTSKHSKQRKHLYKKVGYTDITHKENV